MTFGTCSLAKQIFRLQISEGTALAPMDCWLCLRGMKTLALRVEKQQVWWSTPRKEDWIRFLMSGFLMFKGPENGSKFALTSHFLQFWVWFSKVPNKLQSSSWNILVSRTSTTLDWLGMKDMICITHRYIIHRQLIISMNISHLKQVAWLVEDHKMVLLCLCWRWKWFIYLMKEINP